ncbi:MAG: trehalose-6-phosphate synthase [Deltaproteobacteria bacterium]|nr:trehalose-6-phosphate synthase [Deltaproteobacteria bacterium]
MTEQARIVCISNRLPVSARESEGKIEFQPSSGGLVTAIGPILRSSSGLWIGWPGQVSSTDQQVHDSLKEFSAQSEFELIPVALDQKSLAGFYQGFSNSIIWPLFHDLQSRCNFDTEFWSTYLHVQGLFSTEAQKHIRPNDIVWVHDYHLMGLGRELRRVNISNKMIFFLHTPFPGPDIFFKLPWRLDLIDALLSYDLIGFQTKRDLKNFIDCVEAITGRKCARRGSLFVGKSDSRECLMGAFPISIDFNEFEEIARSEEVANSAQMIRADMGVEYLIVGVDRLDYTKGIPDRIRAFRRLLEMEPALKKKIALLQVVVPSREEVPEYQQLRSEIEQLVTQLNGSFGEPGWVPVHHLFRSLTRAEVVAMYRAADVAIVTPIKDGMNLVAKEYCASRINNGGALVLSEFAGAAEELGEFAFLVNPYDIEGVARALSQALNSSKEDSRGRMKGLRDVIRAADVFVWARSFLSAAQWNLNSENVAPQRKNIWDKLKRISGVFDI